MWSCCVSSPSAILLAYDASAGISRDTLIAARAWIRALGIDAEVYYFAAALSVRRAALVVFSAKLSLCQVLDGGTGCEFFGQATVVGSDRSRHRNAIDRARLVRWAAPWSNFHTEVADFHGLSSAGVLERDAVLAYQTLAVGNARAAEVFGTLNYSQLAP
jgi:hypothetical protein